MQDRTSERIVAPKPYRVLKVLGHVHTKSSTRPGFNHDEGVHSYKEVATWVENFLVGVDAIVFTEHTSNPAKPHQVPLHHPISQSILHELRAVRDLQSQHKTKLLYGVEANVLYTGRLDVTESLLRQLDVVIASRHALPRYFEKTPREVSRTLGAAMENPLVHISGHPNRYVDEADWKEIFEVARQTNTAVEVNFNEFTKAARGGHAVWSGWLRLPAASGAAVAIGIDFHNFPMFRGTLQPGEDELSVGLNEVALIRVAAFLLAIRQAGIPSWRIVTSNGPRFTEWVGTEKPNRHHLLSQWEADKMNH